MQPETIRWLDDMGILLQQPGFEHVPEVGWLAAYTFPTASGEALRIAADLSTLFFVIDNLVEASTSIDDIVKRNHDILRAMSGTSAARQDNAVRRALRDVGRRAEELGGGEWMACFLDQVGCWLGAQVWALKNSRAPQSPPLDDYLTMRPFSSDAYFQFLFSELTDSYRLSPRERGDASVVRLAQMANHQIAWTQDILMLEQDLQHGNVNNLVLCLMRSLALPLERALACAVEMHNHEVESFLCLERDLHAAGVLSPGVQRFVQALKNWMGGHLRWRVKSMCYGRGRPA